MQTNDKHEFRILHPSPCIDINIEGETFIFNANDYVNTKRLGYDIKHSMFWNNECFHPISFFELERNNLIPYMYGYTPLMKTSSENFISTPHTHPPQNKQYTIDGIDIVLGFVCRTRTITLTKQSSKQENFDVNAVFIKYSRIMIDNISGEITLKYLVNPLPYLLTFLGKSCSKLIVGSHTLLQPPVSNPIFV
jgi:hypothetical protein